jgi:hypothetical protein
MYIGVGTLVVILIIVLIIYFIRRSEERAWAQNLTISKAE